MSKTTITAKYLKVAKYESKLFKVCESSPNEKLNKFIKVWEGCSMIYLKEKHLDANTEELELGKFYKMRLYFDEFLNDEGKNILYVSKIRYKQDPDYREKVKFHDNSDDSDY